MTRQLLRSADICRATCASILTGKKTLVSGDALISRDGQLLPPDSRFTLDMPTAIKSLEKLQDYEISTVICYHGGLVTDRVKESLESICRGE